MKRSSVIQLFFRGDKAHPLESDQFTPGGDPMTNVIGDTALDSGNLLRSWLGEQIVR